MNLVETVYGLSVQMPKTERWGLISQMNRASVSVPSNITEGYARQSNGEYRHHLQIARASLAELATQFTLCLRLSFLDSEQVQPILEEIDILSRMLYALIRSIS